MPDSRSSDKRCVHGKGACAHSLRDSCAYLHTRARDRRRLKRSPTSIVLAINACLPQPRLFVYPCRTRDSALSTSTRTPVRPSVHTLVRSFSASPFFIIPRSRVGVTFFFNVGECVFYAPPFPITHHGFIFGALQRRLLLPFCRDWPFDLFTYRACVCGNTVRLFNNVAKVYR